FGEIAMCSNRERSVFCFQSGSQLTSESLVHALSQNFLKPFPAASEPGHDRAYRYTGDAGDFLVRQFLQLAEHYHFAGFSWQLSEGIAKHLGVLGPEQVRFGTAVGEGQRVLFFVEGYRLLRCPILVEPGVAGVAHNSEEPDAAVATTEGPKE